MKVVHISLSDISNGASKATYRLHCAMLKSGIESSMFVQNQTSDGYPKIFRKSIFDDKITSVFRRQLSLYFIRATKSELGSFSYTTWGMDISKQQEIKNADIIYIHQIHIGFLSLYDIEKILQLGKPVFFYMHDMWHITGGCHHSFDCIKYTNKCSNCQFFKGEKEKDFSYWQHKRKLKLFKKYNNISFIAPSKWLTDCILNSAIAKDKSTIHIPNLIDTEIFKPVDRISSRSILNLPYDKKLIAFGADFALKNPYKGWSYLVSALKKIKSENIEIIVFGSDYNEKIVSEISFKIHFLGRLNDLYSLVILYNAADIFVTPSLADNFPSTVLESLACGTPVVGFNVGGIPELVSNETGYLANYLDSDDLAIGIDKVISANNIQANDCLIKASQFKEEVIVEAHRNMWKQF